MLVPQSPSRIAALRSQPNTLGRLVESSIKMWASFWGFLDFGNAGKSIPRFRGNVKCLNFQPFLDILKFTLHPEMQIPFFNSLRFKVGFGYLVLFFINIAVTAWIIF